GNRSLFGSHVFFGGRPGSVPPSTKDSRHTVPSPPDHPTPCSGPQCSQKPMVPPTPPPSEPLERDSKWLGVPSLAILAYSDWDAYRPAEASPHRIHRPAHVYHPPRLAV